MNYEVYYTMFTALEASLAKPEPVGNEAELPVNFPAKEQAAIEKVRSIILARKRSDEAAWAPIINNWPVTP